MPPPTRPSVTSALNSDFRHEFEHESVLHLRGRFLWYCGAVIVLNSVMVVFPLMVGIIAKMFSYNWNLGFRLTQVVELSVWALYAWAFAYSYRRLLSRDRIIDLMTWMMIGAGVARLLAGYLDYAVIPNGTSVATRSDGGDFSSLTLFRLVWTVLWTHALACVFVPWSPKQAMRPILYLTIVFCCVGLVQLIRTGLDSLTTVLVATACFPIAGVPGVLMSMWSQDRFREGFLVRALRGRYTEMRRELTDARRLHEALFPAPQQKGPLRFDYRYEPMRQIGGDFLYAKFLTHDDRLHPTLNLILLDVTGHGIPAALTVNRLYGEVERLFAEHPHIPPSEVLRLLNRYVYLTLSDLSLFVTALAVKIVPPAPSADGSSDALRLGTIEYASAGHPPAFLRSVDGTIEQLDSTAPVLGAFVAEDYTIDTITRSFGPGDAFLGYTDGAMETRDSHGRMLGVEGLQRALAASSREAILRPGLWTHAVITAVDSHRVGPPTDDTLIVEVSCMMNAGAPIATEPKPQTASALRTP